MKIKIHKNDLLKIINIIEVGLTNFSVIESLKGIKISVKNNNISFISSKSELAIVYQTTPDKIDIQIIEEGEIIIPGRKFIEIIKKLNASYIDLITEKNILNIKTNNSHIQLISYDITSYPTIKFELNDYQNIKLNKNILIEGYNKTKYSIDNNPVNPILTGINFKNESNLKISSTDSLRVTLYQIEEDYGEKFNFTINKNLIENLIKIIEHEDEILDTYITNNQLLIKTENIKVKLRLLDGKYPEIEKIIPTNITFSYEINKVSLLESLERVNILTEKNESIVICEINNNQLSLKTSHKFLGKIEETCNIKTLHGTPFKIAFDPDFVLKALNTIEEEDVKFEFVDEVSGFNIKNIENNSIINVISPIRIN